MSSFIPEPKEIGNSLVFELDNTLVQIGQVSVKDLSIHHTDIPPIIVFRPNDSVIAEFSFFHFLINKKQLLIYLTSEQLEDFKKAMQISVFGGETDWAYNSLMEQINELDPELKEIIFSNINAHRDKVKQGHEAIAAIESVYDRLPQKIQELIKLYLISDFSKYAFALEVNGNIVDSFNDFDESVIKFVEYKSDEPIQIADYLITISDSEVLISNKDGEGEYGITTKQDTPVEYVKMRFPSALIEEVAQKNRSKLVPNATAQIGSGDGMANTPNQDTSCALIRQDNQTFILDASVQSIMRSAYFGVNVLSDDIVALLTHGCHGDHGAGFYFIAKMRTEEKKNKLKIYCHPQVLDNYIEKCAYIYKVEYPGKSIETIKSIIADMFEYCEPDAIMITPFNSHPVPTTGFYFKGLNYYISGDMSGAELRSNKYLDMKNLDLRNYYFSEDLAIFDEIVRSVKDSGYLAMECGVPPIHIPKDIIVEIVGGEDHFRERLNNETLFLYHTDGQRDATDWVEC